MRARVGSWLLVLGCVVAGCGRSSVTAARVPPAGDDLARSLLDQRFTVRALVIDGMPVALDSRRPVTVEVRADLWSIDTTCNGLSTAWRVEQGQVRLRWTGGMTLMGCDDPATNRQSAMARLVRSRPTVAYDGLTLAVDGDGVRMEARRSSTLPSTSPPSGPSPSQTLASGVVSPTEPAIGSYRLDEIVTDGVTQAPTGPAVVELSAAGVITVDAGCNRLRAQTSLQADGFHGEFFTTTYRRCDPATATFERLLLVRLDPFTVRKDSTGRLVVTASTLELRSSPHQ